MCCGWIILPWNISLIFDGSKHKFNSWKFLLFVAFPIIFILSNLLYLTVIGLNEIPRYKMRNLVKELSTNMDNKCSTRSIEEDITDLYEMLNERLMITRLINKYVNRDIASIIIDDLNDLYLLNV